jgi:hypothetical protein
MEVVMKFCTKCGDKKPLDQYYYNKKSKDGYSWNCKVCSRSNSKSWRERNPNYLSDYCRDWRKHNPQKRVRWARENRDHMAALDGKKDALKRSSGCVPDDFNTKDTIPFYAEARRLTRETGVLHHVDHIKPLAGGGKHEASNLQVLTAVENIRKGSS